jgi:hypothetical protein
MKTQSSTQNNVANINQSSYKAIWLTILENSDEAMIDLYINLLILI